jgi:hypothetical protein
MVPKLLSAARTVAISTIVPTAREQKPRGGGLLSTPSRKGWSSCATVADSLSPRRKSKTMPNSIYHYGIRLDQARVNRFSNAGISSLQDLLRVLQALDLSCKIELEAFYPETKVENGKKAAAVPVKEATSGDQD